MSRFTYPCLVMQQRGAQTPELCFFHAEVGQVLKWAAIPRLEEEDRAPQRAANQSKIRSVKRFLELDDRNTIPTAIIVRLNIADAILSIKCEQGQVVRMLSFEVPENCDEKTMPGIVIDGQHRLLGMSSFDPTIKIAVVALLNATADETAFQFLVINSKASKVSRDHIRALALNYSKDELETRLKTARLSLSPNLPFVQQANSEEESPFKDLIDYPLNRTGRGIVVPAAIEQSIAHIRSIPLKSLEDEDTLIEFFFAVWRAVNAKWPELWVKEAKLLDKVGIVCMTQYLTDSLIRLADWDQLDLENPDAVQDKTATFLNYQDKRLWTSPWTGTGYDTKVGRQQILEALELVNRNVRAGAPWYTDVPLIDPSTVAE